jgi:hypothetical protein
VLKGINPDGEKTFTIRRRNTIPFSEQFTAADKVDWFTGMGDEKPVLFRLPELIVATTANPGIRVLIPEGEKDVETLVELGYVATCNSGGRFKWLKEFAHYLKGCDAVILPDNDQDGGGQSHGARVVSSVRPYAAKTRSLLMPDGHKDVTAWKESRAKAGKTLAEIRAELDAMTDAVPEEGVTLDDFQAYMPMHNYIYMPTREPWPASSVNSRVPSIMQIGTDGKAKWTPANEWLDKNRSVVQMTWAPGERDLIRDRLFADGAWIERKGITCLNLYRPPTIVPGDSSKAKPWLDHLFKVFKFDDAEHILLWSAHRVQHPEVKINHAIVVGSDDQGIGKDTALEGLKRAVGPWNFYEVSPQQITGRFNGFLKSVVLRVNEARDLGETNRYQFYDHMKPYIASPPDSLRVDEKNLREHNIINCCGVIISTNHKTSGLYLPPDDRRHYVAWSGRVKGDFEEGYWQKIWHWYEKEGGFEHVAALLRELDISNFDPKAPPPKTEAFWAIVDANRAPEESEIADVLGWMGNQSATTAAIVKKASETMARGNYEVSLHEWFNDRKNRKAIGYRFDQCGFVPHPNERAKSYKWKINGISQVVYVKKELSIKERHEAVNSLVNGNGNF